MKKAFILLGLFTLSFSTFSQTDSLTFYLENNSISKAKTSILKLEELNTPSDSLGEAYMKLAEFYELKLSQFDTAVRYYQEAYNYFQLSNNVLRMGNTKHYSGICYASMQEFENSLAAYRKAHALYKTSDKPHLALNIENNIGFVYTDAGQLDSAKYYLINLLLKYDSIPKTNNYLNALNNLGNVYMSEGNYSEARMSYKKALPLAIKNEHILLEANIYINVAGCFHYESSFDSCLYYTKKSIPLYEKIEHLPALNRAYSNLCGIYKDLGDFPNAQKTAFKSIEISKKINDPRSLCTAYSNIAATYNPYKAFQYFDSAEIVGKKHNLKPILKDLYKSQAEYAKKHKEYEKGMYALENLMTTNDSLMSSTQEAIINDLEIKYSTKEKEQQIALQDQQIKAQEASAKLKNYSIIGLIIISTLLVLFVYSVRKTSSKQKQLLIQENEIKLKEKAIEASINSQEKERSRFAQDLHDNMGQLISVMNMAIGKLKGQPQMAINERDENFETCSTVLSDMYAELKNICFDLMPQSLAKSGLIIALQEFSHRINALGKVQIELITFGDDQYAANDITVSQYRICQEWINNIIKYSDAQKITIQVIQDDQEIQLMIEDDGMGFNPELLENSSGYGWKNINARAAYINGLLDLDTAEGRKGNSLILTIPKFILDKKETPEKEVSLTA